MQILQKIIFCDVITSAKDEKLHDLGVEMKPLHRIYLLADVWTGGDCEEKMDALRMRADTVGWETPGLKKDLRT